MKWVRVVTLLKQMAFLAPTALAGCTGLPSGIRPVNDFDLSRYLGTWYEIARLDHRFERGLTDVSATYTAREDGGIDVLNRWPLEGLLLRSLLWQLCHRVIGPAGV